MQYSFFDKIIHLDRKTKLGDTLEQLNTIVDWELFRPIIDQAIPRTNRGKSGRPPYDNLLMFKILIIRRLYNLSFDQLEFQINDRLSFMRFLSLDINERVPDAKTIWHYEERLANNEAGQCIFDRFFEEISKAGYITKSGSIVDASFMEAPRRKNTKEEREAVKRGEIPEDWDAPDHPQKLRQRDLDATWTKKGNEAHFGYKDHVKVDLDSKLIVGYKVTTASTNDLKGAEGLFDDTDNVAYGDSAYPALGLPEGVVNMICVKGIRNHSLSEGQKKRNHKKSKHKCRVEHVFAGMMQMVGGTELRCKNERRAAFNISLLNMLYKMRSVLTLRRLCGA